MRELRMGNAEEAAMERQMIRRGVEDCPRLAQDEKERIDKVARFVARDGDLTETILLRLLKITKNQRRWGFISPDHPHHGYYLRRKISEQCRAIRPPRHMVITLLASIAANDRYKTLTRIGFLSFFSALGTATLLLSMVLFYALLL